MHFLRPLCVGHFEQICRGKLKNAEENICGCLVTRSQHHLHRLNRLHADSAIRKLKLGIPTPKNLIFGANGRSQQPQKRRHSRNRSHKPPQIARLRCQTSFQQINIHRQPRLLSPPLTPPPQSKRHIIHPFQILTLKTHRQTLILLRQRNPQYHSLGQYAPPPRTIIDRFQDYQEERVT